MLYSSVSFFRQTNVDRFTGGHYAVAGLCLVFLALIFIGMATAFLRMTQGPAPPDLAPRREPLLTVIPPAIPGTAVLVLGLHVPPGLQARLSEAARALGGS